MPDTPCRAARRPRTVPAHRRPGALQRNGEFLETAPRHVGDEFVAIAEMPVRRGRADAGEARGFGERKTGRAFLGDQLQRGADQRLFQIAVVIAARAVMAGPLC